MKQNMIPTRLEIIQMIAACFRSDDIANLSRFRSLFKAYFPVKSEYDLEVKILGGNPGKYFGVKFRYRLETNCVDYFIPLDELKDYKLTVEMR